LTVDDRREFLSPHPSTPPHVPLSEENSQVETVTDKLKALVKYLRHIIVRRGDIWRQINVVSRKAKAVAGSSTEVKFL